MLLRVLGADELMAKGIANMSQLRPILTRAMEAQNADGLAVNATLRKNEWEIVDRKVNDVMRGRLTIIDDLRAAGLVTTVGVGTILRVTERVSDFEAAEVSYDGDTAPEEDRPNFQRTVIPVPIIAKAFRFGFRQLAASRAGGEGLDVTSAAIATRKVRDKLEDVVTNGFGHGPGPGDNGLGGTSIPGLTTAANRIQVTLSVSWELSGNDIIGDVLRMLEAAYASKLFGPFILYLPKNWWALIQADYSAVKGDNTIMDRIKAFVDIKDVRVLDSLANSNAVMIQMTEQVIEYTEAQAVTTVQWEKNPFVTQFRVMAIGGPHIKDIETENGTTINGLIHLH